MCSIEFLSPRKHWRRAPRGAEALVDPSLDDENKVQNAALDIDMIDTDSAAFGLKDAVHSEWFEMLCSLFMLCNHTCIIDGGWANASVPKKEFHGLLETRSQHT